MSRLKLYIDEDDLLDMPDALRAPSAGVPLLPDPGFLWQVFRRNMLLFTLVTAAILGLVAFVLSQLTPTYSASANILIEPTTSGPVRTTAPGQSNGIVNADEVDTELRLIDSPLVAERAAELYAAMNLSPDGDAFTEAEIEVLGETLATRVGVRRIGQTRIAEVRAIGSDPEFVAAAANSVANAYLQSQIEAKTSETDAASEFINARLVELERNALNAQAVLDQYKAERGLVSAQGATNAEFEVTGLNTQLASARAELAQAEGRLNTAQEQLSRGGGGQDVGAALGSGTIGGLRQQEASVSARVAALSERYGPRHPERQQAETELRDVRQRINEEITRIISNLEADVQTARSRVSSLQQSRSAALNRLQSNSLAQAGLSRLEQQRDAAQAVYESFLQRSQETGALRDSALPDAQISALADVPRFPVGPRYKVLGAAGGIVAFAFGFLSILIAEYLRRGVRTKRDVERRLRLRYAGAVPTLKSTVGWRRPKLPPHRYVVANPHSLFAESFRSIRTFLTLSPGSKPRAIAISSALPAEGKTTTAVCLALTTAAEGTSTILVDADLRRRGSSRMLRYHRAHDIFDYLLDGVDLDECIDIHPETGLHVLGSNDVMKGASNPLREDLIDRMFDELRDKYDVVIVDTAPILGVADGRVIATLADRVLLVTRWKKTSMRAVESVTSMLINTKAKVTGLALTQVNIKKYASTGDGDVYAYTKKFRGYYQT